MYYLIYSSQTRYPWDAEALKELLQVSVKNNKSAGITGMLIYLKNTFIQLLEGEYKAVNNLYEKITRDPRHERAVILLEGQIETRNFKDWYMGFKTLEPEEFESLSGYKDLKSLFDERTINNQSHPALIFLKLLYDKNYRNFEFEVE